MTRDGKKFKDTPVQIGPGTAGVVQRIPAMGKRTSKQLKVLKQVKVAACTQNEY